MLKNLTLSGLICVIGAFFISLAVGIMYLWGIITIYGTSYFRIAALDNTITENLTNLVFPLTLLGQAISMPIVTRYANKISARITCCICGMLMSSLTYMSSLTTNFNTFALLFGLGNGVIIGIIYILPISHCVLFFPRNRKFISMAIISASGIGTLIFAIMAENCMNANNLSLEQSGYNLYYGKQVADKFPEYIRKLSAVILVFVSGGGLLLSENHSSPNRKLKKRLVPEDKNSDMQQLMNFQFTLLDEERQNYKNPFGDPDYQLHDLEKGYHHKMVIRDKVYGQHSSKVIWPNLDDSQSEYYPPKKQSEKAIQKIEPQFFISDAKESVGECPRTSDGPRQYIFWALFFIIVLGSNFGLMISVNYKTSTKALIFDDNYMTMMGSIGAVACGFSRFIWGSILLKSTFKFLYYSLSIINIFLSFTISFVMDNKQVYFTYVILAYICYGGHLGIFPAATSQIFGKRYGPQIYGILFFSFPCSNFIQYLLVNYVPYGYAFIFKLSGVMSILAILIIKKIELQYDWSQRIRQNNERKRMMTR